MTNFEVGKDYETSSQAGAEGMFQIHTLIDENGTDVTQKIDVGIHFHDDNELKDYLSRIFGMPPDQITLTDL